MTTRPAVAASDPREAISPVTAEPAMITPRPLRRTVRGLLHSHRGPTNGAATAMIAGRVKKMTPACQAVMSSGPVKNSGNATRTVPSVNIWANAANELRRKRLSTTSRTGIMAVAFPRDTSA